MPTGSASRVRPLAAARATLRWFLFKGAPQEPFSLPEANSVSTVLLVDDSPTLRRAMSGLLKNEGYTVETAKDGNDALSKVDGSLRPDLVITDLNMPGLDGMGLIKELRNGRLPYTPILMLTTETEKSKRMEAKQAGATGWLVKPISRDDLVAVLRKVLPRG
ncbi:MAG: response regulator [Myxococcota bacterium]